MKRFATILLALVMILSLTIGASAASITITPPNLEGGSETGITYEAYKIFDATISGTAVAYTIETTSPYWSTIQAYSNLNTTEGKTEPEYFTLTKAAGSETTYVVTKTDAYTDTAANSFADVLKAVTGATAVGTVAKDENGNYVISDLTDGYYLVTSSVGSDLILDTIGDITVATKNEYPGLEKKVEGQDSTTADMGEVLTFTIKVSIPEDAVGEIVVHDKMTGLEYQSWTAVEGITVATADLGDQCAVHFTLSANYVKSNRGKDITIEYTAKVTADVANNEAWLVDGSYETKPDETKVYSTDIVIDKVDANNQETKLSGAEFVLYKLEGEKKLYYKYDEATKTVSWVDTQEKATKVTTDSNGAAEFTDIADGTYYLVETKAPTGYNLLTAPVEVKVEAKLDNEGKVIDIVAGVANSSGSELPETGGVGTTMFYLFGGIMVLAAVVLLVTKKRMTNVE